MRIFELFTENIASKDKETLVESYEERVKDAAMQIAGSGMSKEDFISAFAKADVLERKLGGSDWKDFQKDALKAAKDLKLLKKKERPLFSIENGWGEKVPFYKKDINELSSRVQIIVSNSFPDADPIDQISSLLKKAYDINYVDAMEKLLPLVYKRAFGEADLYKHLADMWDDAYADAKHDFDIASNNDKESVQSRLDSLGGPKNPWK